MSAFEHPCPDLNIGKAETTRIAAEAERRCQGYIRASTSRGSLPPCFLIHDPRSLISDP